MKLKTGSIVFAVIALVVVGGIAGVKYLIGVSRYQKSVEAISISDVDMKNVTDGIYDGNCDVGFISAKVSVTVKGGVITELTLLQHKNDRGASAEKVIGDILNEQTLDVDTVSGATNSSMVIKKAVENALLKGAA